MEVNETVGEWRVADKGGNFVKEEEVTATGREMKNDTIIHSSWRKSHCAL